MLDVDQLHVQGGREEEEEGFQLQRFLANDFPIGWRIQGASASLELLLDSKRDVSQSSVQEGQVVLHLLVTLRLSAPETRPEGCL